MSLRAFHIVFIAISAALCAWLVGWGWLHRADTQGAVLAALGGAGFVGLAVYLRYFLRSGLKPRLTVLALLSGLLLTPLDAAACTVCAGNVQGDTATAFLWGIGFLAALVLLTLGGITAMMLKAIREQEIRREG